MRKKFLLMLTLLILALGGGGNLFAQVAKVGNTEYATIDEAIDNWTNGTTLTLLADVTLSDVIKLSSTEHHILDLGTYTMTAKSGKDAIQYVVNGRSSASYALDIKADANNPGGITANGKAIVVHTKPLFGAPSKDRPITRFYGGVFNASNIVKQSGYTGSTAPHFYFYGGEFNGKISTNRSLNQFYGGTFNGQLWMSVDSSAYTLIAGGTFKYLSNLMNSELNSDKFTIGSGKGEYDKEVYIDDNGNYVIAAAEPAEGIEADVAKTPGTNDYLAYSKVATEGKLNYTDVKVALEKNNSTSAEVTVYVEELDMTGINFKGTIVVPEGNDITITNAPSTLKVELADGTVLTPDENGTVATKLKVATLAELQAALAAENELPIIITETIVIPEGETVVLDLNGKTVTRQDEANQYALRNLGDLTIKDTKGNGSINARGIYNGYGDGGANVVTAKITVVNGDINAKGTNGGAAIFNYGIADIQGGNFTSIGGYSLNNQAGASMTIADGVTANNGIYASGTTLVVNGGEISGNRSGCHVLYAWNSTVTIKGGDFYNNNSGNSTTMAAGTTELTITGGTFGIKDGRVPGNGNTWTSCLTDTQNSATMTVNGGTFNGGFRVQGGTTMTINGGSFNDCCGSGYNIYGTAVVKGGTFTDAAAKNFAKSKLAEGYELNADGTVTAIPVAEVNGTKYTSIEDALAAAQSGDEIKLLANIEGNITVPESVKFNGNDFTVNGIINAAGDITFAGVTKAGDLDFVVGNTVVNIPAGASLQLNGTNRMSIGFGTTFNITGTITDAKTADKATLTPSLVIPGASFSGSDGVKFNVTNAYISVPSSYCSTSKTASGTFDFNITNSIWESVGKLAFEEQSVNAKVDFALVNSVLTTGSHLVFGAASGEEGVVIDNSNVNVGTSRQLENCGNMIVKNGSVVNGAVATSSNAKNPGTLTVEDATYAVTGEFSGSDLGTGTIIIKKGANFSAGSITKANIVIDAAEMTAGELANFTANLAKFAGELSVINNDKLEAKIENGKIVLVAKPVAKIGEQGYATLDEAVQAAQDGDKITLLNDADLAFAHNPQYNNVYASEIDLNGKTMTIKKGDIRFDNVTIKNGNIIVQPGTYNGTAIFLMYSKNLTFNDVKVTATGVATSAYLIGLEGASNLVLEESEIIVNNESLVNIGSIIADNGNGNTVTIKDSKIDIKNSNARLYLGGKNGNITVENSDIDLNGVKEGFYLRAGQTLAITGNSTVDITLITNEGRYGINLTDVTATYTKAETATVIATVHDPVVAMIGTAKYASLQAAVNAVQNGETITLTADITENVTLTEKTGLTYTIDGNGKTMEGAISVNSLSDTNDNRRITVKNIKFVDTADANVDFISSVNTNHYPRLTIEGCTFTGSGNDGDVAVRLKSSHSVVIKDCTGTGLHSFLQNTSGWNLTIENVKVENSKSGLALGTVQGVTVKGCNITADGYGIRMDAQYNNNAVIESNTVKAFIPVVVRKAEVNSNMTFEGENEFEATNEDDIWCAIGTSEYDTNGTMPTAATGRVKVALNGTGLAAAGIYGNFVPVAKIGEVEYASLQEAIIAAAPAGTVDIIADITVDEWIMIATNLTMGDGTIITLDINGMTINGNNHTITIKDIESAGNGGYLFYDAAELNIKELTISYAAGLTGGICLKKGTIEKVTFTGGKYGVLPGANGVTIKECTFNGTTSYAVYYEDAREGIVVTGNKFNTAEGAYAIIMRSNEEFTNNTIEKGKVNIANSSKATVTGNNFGDERFKVYNGAEATIENNKINNLEFNDGTVVNSTFGTNTLSEAAQAKFDAMLVAQIGDVKYLSLQKALNDAAAGTGNVTVTILKDINLTGNDWNPVTVSAPGYPVVTVEGNDKTIEGLNNMLFAGTWAGKSGLIIKNLVIANSEIKHDVEDTNGNIGVGAFVGFPQASSVITLDNCHLVKSTVEGGHWTGGLIGYAAGYAGTDGPVFMNLTVNNCSVKKSTIKGKGSVGGIIGHGSGNAWTMVEIKETTVSGNTITSTGSSVNKAGAVMGTIGAAGQAYTVNGVEKQGGALVAATVSGNTVKSNETAITTIYGRQGTSTGVLELNGGSYDNYPIEEGVAYAKPAEGFVIKENEDGTFGVKSFEGEGTAEKPYMINDLEDLIAFRNSVNSGAITYNTSGVWVALGNDIDMVSENWTPIGTEEKPFVGNFDGKDKTIKNINIVETEAKEGKAYIGLFGYAKNVTIKNVVFENVNLNIACLDIDHSQGHIGAVAGSLEGTSTIENVTVTGVVKVEATFDANGASRVAVVAGGNSYGNVTMKNVHVNASENSYLKANNNVGALAGQLQGKNVFENCSSNIDVTGKKFFAGGIIGLAAGDSQFTNCHTTGDVTVTAGREGRANDQYRVGGIAGGWADGKTKVCTLTGCTYTGKVSGTNADGSVAKPLDYAGYVGRGYTLNGCAGSKVVIDGREYIQVSDSVFGVYEIGLTTPAALMEFAAEVNEGNTFAGKTVKLTNDIDLASTGTRSESNWTPIKEFNGVFDGQNHTISNLVIKGGSNSDQGFFGRTNDGEIKNVTFENAKVSGRLNVGVVAGTPYTSKYTNVKVTGHVEVNGMAYVGAVGGKNAYADWTDITVDVDATSYVKANSVENGTAYRTYVGGVVGFNGEGGHTFKKISSNIKVIGSTKDIGGIFGIAHYSNKFENITFTGSVEAPAGATEVGGIAGVWHNAKGYTVTFTDCTSTGTVTIGEETTTGSIVGGAYNAANETSETSGSLIIDGVEAWLKVAEVNGVKYLTLAEAAAAAQYGDTIKILDNLTIGSSSLTLPAGITLDGNGKTIDGGITAGGDLTFVGHTKVSTFSAGYYDRTITIGEDACLEVTGGRMTVSYGNTINVTGSIDEAKSANKAEITPSLIIEQGLSFNGDGRGVEFNITNAYVKLGDSSSKNSGATGKFNFNFVNSIVDFTKTLKTYEPTKEGLDPSFEINVENSVVSFASHLELWNTNTALTLNNSNLTVGSSFANAGTINVTNGANFVVNAPIMSSHGGNTGTINIKGGVFKLKDSNQDWENAGTIKVNAVGGKLITNDFKCVGEGKIVVDAENLIGTVTVVDGNGVYNFANITEIINGESVNVSYENGDVTVTKVLATIGENEYQDLQEAIEAAGTTVTTITIMASFSTDDYYTIAAGQNITLNLNGMTITGTDKTEKSFGLINNKGTLTIVGNSNNRAQQGALKLSATVNSGWNRYSAVISNQPGGKLTVNGGTIEHLGGTDMAYAIDNLTNGKGTYAETEINGGTVKSTYRAIRQFLNGIEAQNILTVNGGTIEGTNKSIWMQDPSKNANTGTLIVNANANLYGDVYLSVTEGSTEWPVEVAIVADAIKQGTVLTSNVPEGYLLVAENGLYTVETIKVKEQTINLNNGWTWVSLFVDATGESGLESFENQLEQYNADNQIVQIKNQTKAVTYQSYYGNYGWYGNLKSLAVNDMYMVKIEKDNVVVELEDYKVNPADYEFNLVSGWTWLGFPSTSDAPVAIEYALQNITPNKGDQIKSQEGFATYTNNKWYGNLSSMTPGMGYMYKNNSDNTVTLKYPAEVNYRGVAPANITAKNNLMVPNMSKYANNMSIIAVVNIDGEELMTEDFEVAVFAGEELRGSARPIYVEDFNSYMLFLTVYGEASEELTFKYYDLNSGEELNLFADSKVVFEINSTVGSLEEALVLNYGTLSIDETSLNGFNVYPNPVNRDNAISFETTFDKVEVYNSLGVVVAEYNNVDKIDGIEAAGIYVIKVTNDNVVKYCRVIVK